MIRAGNRLTLLDSAAYFPALLQALDAATEEIHLESYLFRADHTGQAVVDALARAAQRGVTVRVLLDGFGARDLPRRVRDHFDAAGVQWQMFRPVWLHWRARQQRMRRMHRKLVLVDARLGYIGGINVLDNLEDGRLPALRHDYMVEVAGPVIADMHASARRLWQRVCWSRLGRAGAIRRDAAWRPPDVAPAGTQRAEFVERDTLRRRRAIEARYLQAIHHARHEIVIANAYFLPGVRFRHALMQAARRGVRVVLMVQGYTDHPLYRAATRALYGYFLENGVEIYEYEASELHAKVAVVDARWATVGSSNIDPFSLLLAREANLFVHDAPFAETLLASLEDAMRAGARPIHRMNWRRRSRGRRVLAWLAYGWVRALMGLAGVALGWDRPRGKRDAGRR